MRKRILDIIIPAIPVVAVLASMIFSPSCANTTTPPTGGPKDTIPPVLTKVSPGLNATNVSTKKQNLVFTFNEYVVVKDPKSLFLSPPMEKAPKFRLKNKSVVVYFEEDLDSNRTYSLDLTNAIGDNNEGNMFPGYTLVFSTGNVIDSMMVTGTIVDCNTLMPVKGATVMLYKDQRDSAVFLSRPDAAVKTDDWGFFCIRNIQDTLYRMYAIKDENNNNRYEPETELIAFLDSTFKPDWIVRDTIMELKKFDMKDTISCLNRKSQVEISLFKEKPSTQMIVNKERVGERTAYITFMAPDAKIDSIWIKNVPAENLITQFNIQKDSLEIWVNDPKQQPDTLYLYVDYLKTDTLGVLTPFVEEVKLSMPKGTGGKTASKSSTKDIKKEDTTCVMKVEAKGETIEQYGFVLETKYPLVESAFDSLTFKYLNPKQQEFTASYTVEQDSLNLRKYTIKPNIELLVGYEYFLKFPHRKFKDINGFYNDSLEVKVKLPNDDKLSTLNLEMKNVNNKYIVELLNEKRNQVLRQYIISSDQMLKFPYLKAGKYSIRITEDVNKNGVVDTGNLLEGRQPEKVKFYKLENDSFLLDIIEMSEVQQTLDLKEMFK